MTSKNPSAIGLQQFSLLGKKFLDKTNEHVLQGINPGGIYQAIWCRDAAYILMDWFRSGNIHGVMQQIHQIWSHQIKSPPIEKVIYGRGSIDMKFLSQVYTDRKTEFEGALPSTIYQAGFSEVYGQKPDIDSTALMISTTANILAVCANKEESFNPVTKPSDNSDYLPDLLLKAGITDPIQVTEYVIPKMFDAVRYLGGRDVDGDALLEQGHNEDWMDTILRAGKIVYSQACWILALTNFSILLDTLGRTNESRKMAGGAERVIKAVDDILWSEEDNSYIDMQEEHHLGAAYRTLMQDVSLYLIAAQRYFFKNNKQQEIISNSNKAKSQLLKRINTRSEKTLQTMKKRLWRKGWPLVTEVDLKVTGPWVLEPFQYHNRTMWPWCTALEIVARGKFNQAQECTALLSEMSSGKPYMFSFYEWINPINKQPGGAFPFRTGISALRVAIADIINPQF